MPEEKQMSDFEDLDGDIEKRQRKALDKDAKFARRLARLTDGEFDVIKGKLITEAEARPPDSSPNTDRTQLYKSDSDGNATDEVASNSDLYNFLKGVGVPDSSNVSMTLSEHMQRERQRRAGQGESNG